MRDVYKVDLEEIKKIKWQGDADQYDLALHELGNGQDEFIILNPTISNPNLYHCIHEIPDTDRCVFWFHEDEWVAKYFKKQWSPKTGYKEVQIIKPERTWRKNPDLDRTMVFEDDTFGLFEPEPWDMYYELVWYIDPRFNPLDDKVWAISCKPIGIPTIGVKDMGYVAPQVDIEFNEHIPALDINIDECYPAFFDLLYECAWELDPVHSTENDKLWVVKFTPRYRKPKEWKWYGVISPEVNIEYNPDLGELHYDLDLFVPWYNLGYEHIWMLDNKHLEKGEDEIWAFKIRVTDNIVGSKFVDYVSPNINIEYNPDLGELNYNLDLVIPWHDLRYEHLWMLDNKHLNNGEDEIWAFKIRAVDNIVDSKLVDYISPIFKVEYNKDLPSVNYNSDYIVPWHDLQYEHTWYLEGSEEKIWAVKLCAVEDSKGEKDMGTISLILPRLDVIFISYHESNADKNWERVLEKAPWAKRVDGVDGIFNAHKTAAKLANTDMFFVVDGDAWLVDNWTFDFQPNIFDRDCAYVWSSMNPVNDLTYQNGGVKLFNKSILMRQKKWTTLDMFTGIMPKIKAEDTVSCITTFNVDEFSTWRSAFRESVKLYMTNQMSKLTAWLNSDVNKPFGEFAVLGSWSGSQYAKENKDNHSALLKINDYKWLEKRFKEIT